MAAGGKHTWRSSNASRRGSGPSPSKDECDITFETVLHQVDQELVQSLTRGNKLQIEMIEQNKLPRLVALLNNARVGSISHPKALELIACMEQGTKYVGVVLKREGNLCGVRVERA